MTTMSGAAHPRGRGVAIATTRPHTGNRSHRVPAVTAALALILAVAAGACSSSSAKAPPRPVTNAKLEIVSPQANSTVPSTFKLVFKLTGGEVVSATSTALRGDQGHIHVSVDGRIVSMAYGLSQTVSGLTKGEHTISSEFVAADHRPFANRKDVIVRIVVTVA
jgi:hypothetical protein